MAQNILYGAKCQMIGENLNLSQNIPREKVQIVAKNIPECCWPDGFCGDVAKFY